MADTLRHVCDQVSGQADDEGFAEHELAARYGHESRSGDQDRQDRHDRAHLPSPPPSNGDKCRSNLLYTIPDKASTPTNMSTERPFEHLSDPRTAPVDNERESADRINEAVDELLNLGAEESPQAASDRVIAKEQLLTKHYEETFGKRVAEDVIRDVLREIPEVEQVVPAPRLLDLGEKVDTFVVFKNSPLDPANENAPKNTRMLAIQGKMFDLEASKTDPNKRDVQHFAKELSLLLKRKPIDMAGKPVPLAMIRASERLLSKAFNDFEADQPSGQRKKNVADYLPNKDRFRIGLLEQLRRFLKQGIEEMPARAALYEPWAQYLGTIEQRLETQRLAKNRSER